MSRRRDPQRGMDRGLPLLDAEMWEAPAHLTLEACLDEVAAEFGGPGRREREDEL